MYSKKSVELFLFYSLFLISCTHNQQQPDVESTNIEKDTTVLTDKLSKVIIDTTTVPFDLDQHLEQYRRLKRKIALQNAEIKSRNDLDPKEKTILAKQHFNNALIDSIFPYWLGTPWDFNGHTANPRDGLIACGYFVSTTLRDVGFDINRYKIAQKGASDIIKALCDESSVQTFDFIHIQDYLKKIPNRSILLVGLDYHVGFIIKRKNSCYFAHSNYINLEGVVIEAIERSQAFKNSSVYVVGDVMEGNIFKHLYQN